MSATFGELVMQYGFKQIKSIIPIHGRRGAENRAAIVHALRDVLATEPYVYRQAVAKSLADEICQIDNGHFPLVRTSEDATSMIATAVRVSPIKAITLGDALRKAFAVSPDRDYLVEGAQRKEIMYYANNLSLSERLYKEFTYLPTFRAKSAEK